LCSSDCLRDGVPAFGDGPGPPYDRSKLRVLMSLDPATTNMGARWINRKDSDFALTWVKSYGKGRIFNTSFGHITSLYSNPQVLQFHLDAIQFASGDLDAPTAPRKDRPVRKPVPGTQPAPGLKSGFVSLGDPKKLLEAVKIREWNDYVVVAKDGSVVLKINGVTMCELEDRDPNRLVHG
jgi:hypothetical protein